MFAFLAAHRAEVFPDADYADLLLPVTEMSDEGGVQGADVGMFEGPAAGVAVGPWW